MNNLSLLSILALFTQFSLYFILKRKNKTSKQDFRTITIIKTLHIVGSYSEYKIQAWDIVQKLLVEETTQNKRETMMRERRKKKKEREIIYKYKKIVILQVSLFILLPLY